MAISHTLGPQCRLTPISRQPDANGMSLVDAQFFYSTFLPMDDPLSISESSKSDRKTMRPFGPGDNIALEKAWQSLSSDRHRRWHQELAAVLRRRSRPYHDRKGKGNDNGNDGSIEDETDTDEAILQSRQSLIHSLTISHWAKHRSSLPVLHNLACLSASSASPRCCPQLIIDISHHLESRYCSMVRANNDSLNVERLAREICTSLIRHAQADPTRYTLNRKPSQVKSCWSGLGHTVSTSTPAEDTDSSHTSYRMASVGDDGISGRPFIRVTGIETVHSSLREIQGSSCLAASPGQASEHVFNFETEACTQDADWVDVEVAVGVSRLHKVTLPLLQMKPIYWSPVNDVAIVTRATWFYRDTMMPVAPVVANRLEMGYRELRPWTQTWQDELACAIHVGTLGEEKISHPLWLQDSPHRSATQGYHEADISSDPFCAARCCRGDAAAQGSSSCQASMHTDAIRPFAHYHVVYKDDSQAFLLKPSLKPSTYYGRKPVLKIVKGLTVGIPVTRGFNREAWNRLYTTSDALNPSSASPSLQGRQQRRADACPACQVDQDDRQVSDLILVAHGIGQKFAQRVESFHFTHAINSFRRAVNLEMTNPVVQQILRKDHKGIMILPLNWRAGLSLEDSGPVTNLDVAAPVESFSLKDIEPETIPVVRSIISDVIFDIPFYMSQHKTRMVKALVLEANRVYRLWCLNNPGFITHGRVHLIAHSLGSAMALDVLSRQPTMMPLANLARCETETRFFEFDTKNLFLLGSPAGFFLLLEHGALVPRRGRPKPDAEARDIGAEGITAEAGTFGCLAVDNVYNILAKEDPIAYLLNGAIDPVYSASLKTAHVPSVSASVLTTIANAVRHIVPGIAPIHAPLAADLDRPTAIRLPSQLELEVHDFRRERMAEKKAFLLNDNGQVDWILRSGGRPLELQYLNMLSAHTSYWTNQDFIRMLCIEVGRKPGRLNTLPSMRATKAARQFYSTNTAKDLSL